MWHSLDFLGRFVWRATAQARGRVALSVIADAAALAAGLCAPLALRTVIDKLPNSTSASTDIIFWLAIYGTVWTLSQCLPRLQHVVLISVLETIKQSAQREYLTQLLAHSPRYHAAHKSGSQLAQLKRIEQAIPAAVIGTFLTIVPTCVQILLATGVVFTLFDAKYAAILLLCLVGYLASTFLTTGRATALQRAQIKRVDAAEHGVVDLLNNIEAVKAYAREADEVTRQDGLMDARRRGDVRIAWHMEKLGLAQLSFLGIGVLVMTVVAGMDVIGRHLTYGTPAGDRAMLAEAAAEAGTAWTVRPNTKSPRAALGKAGVDPRRTLFDDPSLLRMVRQLRLDEVIGRCPEGLDAAAGTAGNRFSGGEKQRLSLGRALSCNAPVLLLDEPTSALDAHTEEEIHRMIAGTTRVSTRLIVVHRLKTILDADLILVFDQGRIVERGTHGDLLAARGVYAALWDKERSASSESVPMPQALAACRD